MTKYPLFGEDSSPSYTSRTLSLIITAVFCLIFLLCTAFVKPFHKKPKYKTVQIVLNDAPKQQKKSEQAATAAPAPAAPAQAAEAPAKSEPAPAPVKEVKETPKPVQKAVETPKPAPTPKAQSTPKTTTKTPPKTENKTAPAKTTKDPAPVKQKIYEDPMDAFNNQTKAQPKKEFDWSQFDDSEPVVESQSQPQKSVEKQTADSGFSGSAGSTTQTKTEPIKSTSSSSSKTTSTAKSSGTNKALESIAKEEGVSNTNTSGTSQKATQTGKSASNNDIKWTGGAARKLIMPKEPNIKFSEANQNLLGSYKEINIIFDVEANGYVVRNSIKTSPVVPQSVLGEIADQVGDWWFEEGDSTATATLLCIIKRN